MSSGITRGSTTRASRTPSITTSAAASTRPTHLSRSPSMVKRSDEVDLRWQRARLLYNRLNRALYQIDRTLSWEGVTQSTRQAFYDYLVDQDAQVKMLSAA